MLEQRIQAMKLKNEELRRRHLEVEADKQVAAKQNALVKMNVPHDDDWIPGRHDDNPRQHNDSSLPSNHERTDDRNQRTDHRRSRNDNHRDDGHSYNHHPEENASGPRPFHNSQNFEGRRNDRQYNRQRSDEDRHQNSETRRSGDWSGRADGPGGRFRERGSYPNRGFRNNTSPGDTSRSNPSTFTSKVFKNSSMDSGKRQSYRLAEGDGPPPDPSYSFLGDSMRDSPESGEKRRGQPNRRGFQRGRGRGGQTWNNRALNDSGNEGFENRREGQSRNHDDSRHHQQSYEAAWRKERSMIDQERINRQKTSDGNWSREWDSNKVFQEANDRPQRWKRGNQTQNYDRNSSRRGYQDDAGYSPRQNYKQRNDAEPNTSSHDPEYDQSPNKFIRRGRFSNQNRLKGNFNPSNGSIQAVGDQEISRAAEDAALIESNVKTLEQLQVSVVSDPSGGGQKRCVEGVGGNLRISVSTEGELSEGVSVEQKRPRKGARKSKRSRILSTTSTGTTGTAEGDDGSWEDMSSDEDISVLAELQKGPRQEMGTSRCADVSSGPESLDPIPAPGKEDEFLWDDFHPAGFQDNATLVRDAEVAYQALLDEKAKLEVCESGTLDNNSQPPKVSFRLDTACLEDSGDELDGAKLDPLLVTTQIVQAEVDCMSLTSLPIDTSLPEEISQLGKVKNIKDEQILEEEAVGSQATDNIVSSISAEELSGPVSILDVPSDSSHLSGDQDTGKDVNDVTADINVESPTAQNFEEASNIKLQNEAQDGADLDSVKAGITLNRDKNLSSATEDSTVIKDTGSEKLVQDAKENQVSSVSQNSLPEACNDPSHTPPEIETGEKGSAPINGESCPDSKSKVENLEESVNLPTGTTNEVSVAENGPKKDC